jgi:hypothetical protein
MRKSFLLQAPLQNVPCPVHGVTCFCEDGNKDIPFGEAVIMALRPDLGDLEPDQATGDSARPSKAFSVVNSRLDAILPDLPINDVTEIGFILLRDHDCVLDATSLTEMPRLVTSSPVSARTEMRIFPSARRFS